MHLEATVGRQTRERVPGATERLRHPNDKPSFVRLDGFDQEVAFDIKKHGRAVAVGDERLAARVGPDPVAFTNNALADDLELRLSLRRCHARRKCMNQRGVGLRLRCEGQQSREAQSNAADSDDGHTQGPRHTGSVAWIWTRRDHPFGGDSVNVWEKGSSPTGSTKTRIVAALRISEPSELGSPRRAGPHA